MINIRPTTFVMILIFALDSAGYAVSSSLLQSAGFSDADRLVERAREGDREAVEALLKAGVDVNGRSKMGETALAAAAGSLNEDEPEDIVDLLLTRGARVDDRSFGGAAIWADIRFGWCKNPSNSGRCGNSIGPMGEAYQKLDKLGVTALLAAAAAARHSKIVRRLLEAGADPNAKTFQGATPLMLATIANDVVSVKALLLKGADVNARAYKGQTALMLASWSDKGKIGLSRLEVVGILVDAGANVNALDEYGRSALTGANEADNQAAARFLISRGARVHVK